MKKHAGNVKFGKILKEFRNNYNVKMRELAKHLDVSISYISRIESGDRDPIPTTYLPKIIECLGLSASEAQKLIHEYCISRDRINILPISQQEREELAKLISKYHVYD